ncbi:hypothetical protein Deba_1851 [Desulfarculus baarsii DSM 2075]|uniref:Uncharacterized protein n=1 Tax=Desulfarculus baarsii (strain ATCC 33931 / DSM 2075 / LMG 7858 / VKM B-1802 / 2st14) TaxID=644282 RepID=E1QI23_DESB2|nr:hypothetical protein [Desulfarculus baarsii]ADK85216.1 hypothetical protein Deba_1851 [Desulfarculus baarsii DSM 2075]
MANANGDAAPEREDICQVLARIVRAIEALKPGQAERVQDPLRRNLLKKA